MITAITSISFLYPWVLAGFVLLPVIWFILRIMPPSPRTINFAAARFLDGLIPDNQSHAHTPWWIMAIRLIALSLILTALAGPVINRNDALPSSDAVRLVIDNSWSAGPYWEAQKEKASEIIQRAGRENKPLYILTTAPRAGQSNILTSGPITASNALNIIKGLKYTPWESDYQQVIDVADNSSLSGTSVYSFFLSHGMNSNARKSIFSDMIKTLQNKGGASVIAPNKADMHIATIRKDPKAPLSTVHAQIVRPENAPAYKYTAEILGKGGQILDRQFIDIEANRIKKRIEFDVPPALKGNIQKIMISGQNHAAAVMIFDDQNKRRNVGIVSTGSNENNTSLIDAHFYIDKALAPYHEIHSGTIADLLANEPAVMILPDISSLPAEDLDRLEKWIKNGGILLRFAGPATAATPPVLAPVQLRRGERALEGALTWDKPLKIAPFTEDSPLYGLDIPAEISIRRQVLTEPAAANDAKYWATLEDGTPLISAKAMGDGLITMVHVTANPEWSNLPLSGLYVQMLRRIINLAGKSNNAAIQDGDLQPLLLLNGLGQTVKPQGYEHPLKAANLAEHKPSSINPPGLYGRGSILYAFNLGERLSTLSYIPDMPLGVSVTDYKGHTENNLMPLLFFAAFILFIADWALMMILHIIWRFNLPFFTKDTANLSALIITISTAIILLMLPSKAIAQNTATYSTTQMQGWSNYANGLYIGYVETGNNIVDSTSKKGLEALAKVLTQRTSAEPDGIVAVDLEAGYLSFFPFIYWPISDEEHTISTRALHNVQHYLDHGGTILFDTRDQVSTPSQGLSAGIGRRSKQLRIMLGSLNIPSLEPISQDHVLGRTFYLLDDFDGRYSGGTLWVESRSAGGRDGVSSVIIGGNDWASAWAGARITQSGYVSTSSRAEEMALRFGVNVMMYALTGNYKDDQVHLPHILERLGQ